MTRIQTQSTKFYKDTPAAINPESLIQLIEGGYKQCRNKVEASYIDSKFNSYRKNPKESEWYGFFSELVYRKWLQENLNDKGRVIFAKQSENDLKIIAKDRTYNVEVKTIIDSDFNRIMNDTLREISRISTGTIYFIKHKSKHPNDSSSEKKIMTFDKDCKELISCIKKGTQSEHWEIETIGKYHSNDRTSIIGPIHSQFVDMTYIQNVINRRLMENDKIRKQIVSADIICFFFLSTSFDAEDVLEAFHKLPKDFDRKLFGYFTQWQDGKPHFYQRFKTKDEVLSSLAPNK